MNDDDYRLFAPRESGDDEPVEAPTESDRALEEKVMERLRAADPASDVEPSAELPAVVARRVEQAESDDEAAASAPAPAADPDAADPDEPAAPIDLIERRRRPAWYAPAAAAAAAVLVGVGGYAVGASNGSGSSSAADAPAAESAPAPISLSSSEGAMAAPSQAPGTMQEGASDSAFSSSMSRDMAWYGPGRTTFSSSGLSTAERSAQTYGLDAVTPSTAERIAQAAAALGMEGVPELADGGWNLAEGGRTFGVYLDGALSLNYYDNDAYPWCDGCEEPDPADAPSGDAAIERLKEILTALGLDPAAYEFSAPTYEGAVTAQAQARRIVDGQGTDQQFYLELAPAGIASVSGSLADVVDLGTYPVVSEQEGVERLSDPRFGAGRTGWPMPVDGDMTVMEEWTPPTEAPAAPSAGIAISWPVQHVEIVSARLGLAQQWQPDGAVLLVPSYEFTDADGGTWSVIAVADDQLDFSTE